MTKSMKRVVLVRTSGLVMLAALYGAAIALPAEAMAQAAGGSQRGVGAPLGVDGALLDRPGPIEPPRCIHRAIDLRRSSNVDDNRLTVWVTVRLPALAVVKASGTASGKNNGTLAISVIGDGVPLGKPALAEGTNFIAATTGASMALIPGRQYKFSAKGLVSDKHLDLFDLYVGVGKTCA